VLQAGDLIDDANDDAQWGEVFDAAGYNFGTQNFLAAAGNHEYEGAELSKQWQAQFEYPANGPQGSAAINALLDLPASAVATYTLTMAVPAGFTGDLVNTVTVAPGAGNTDPVPGNNTATDTNSPATANLSITKTSNTGPFPVGGNITYTIVASNAGPSAADNAVVRDDWTTVPGLDCSAGPATCAASGTAATQCPAPASVTPAGLQAGLAIPAFPNGGIVTFTLQCQITATGVD
jgi:hypothetical protein